MFCIEWVDDDDEDIIELSLVLLLYYRLQVDGPVKQYYFWIPPLLPTLYSFALPLILKPDYSAFNLFPASSSSSEGRFSF